MFALLTVRTRRALRGGAFAYLQADPRPPHPDASKNSSFLRLIPAKKPRFISIERAMLWLNTPQDKRIISTYLFKYFD
ncbi:MAG: hypothetical protein LW838_12630 [Nitrosomonadaceae bacterium]|jgi:hypothetical protein|nr:hypothetical protein [Nitrosomonadaceae bacterium]